MWIRKQLTLSLLLIATFMSQNVFSQEKPYVVGVELLEYYPQYSYDDVYGYRGVYKEILDLFSSKSGHQFTYRALPIKRLYRDFLHNKVDFKYPDNMNWKSTDKIGIPIKYSAPVVSYTDGVLVLPERKGLALTQLKKLSTPRGFTPYVYLDLISEGSVEVTEVNSFQDTLKIALLKKVDGAYINVSVAEHQMESILHIPGALVFDPALPHSNGSYRLSTIKHPKIISEFDQFLEDNKTEIIQIKKKYHLD